MAFIVDVNLRVQDILGLQKIESAISKMQGTAQVGAAAGAGASAGAGTSAIVASANAQSAAATTTAASINKVTVATNKMNAVQGKSATSLAKTTGALGKAGKSAETFGQKVKLAGVRYAAFLTATIGPIAVIGALGKATAAVIEFDSAMLKLRQITGETEQEISGLRGTILDLATSTGTSAAEISRVGKTLAQAGLRGDELVSSLDALSKVPLTPSFETMDAAIEGTIAALNQFNSEGLTTADILDVMTGLSNKFAASSEDIAKGISRGGAAFEAIGGTFREFASIFTTIRQATRESAETVGTFMKTISSRLADPKIVNFLEGKGIRISEAIEAGNPVEAIKRIASALGEITSVQDRIEIGTKLGGRRQISRLLALVSNIDVLDETLKVAASSSGEFSKIAEEGLKGLQAQVNIMVQEWNKLVQTLAEPLFVPLIKMAITAGKSLASMVDFVKPIIPALTTIVGFAAGFKLLAVSITHAAKALAFMATVGKTLGGGLATTTAALGAAAGGGAAGVSARERVQRRLGGGVGVTAGQAAVAGGLSTRLAGGAKAAAASQVGQLAAAAGILLAANKASESFEKAGNSAGVFAAEAAGAAAIIGIAVSALSGKSIAGALAALGPLGAIAATAAVAIGAMTYAANKAAEIDIQKVLDNAVKKMSEIEVKPIEAGDQEGFQEAIGLIGAGAIEGIQDAASQFEDDWFDFFANASRRAKNLLSGEGIITIGASDTKEIIDRIIGSNPELLNETLKSAIEQFGVAGLEGGLDQAFAKLFGGNIEAAVALRKSMVTQLGGLDKIAKSIDQVQLDAKVTKLGNEIDKAAKDFKTLHIPSQISVELDLLSDAVGKTARAIETNVALFDKLSQQVGQGIGVAKPGTEFSREAVRKIISTGEAEGFTSTDKFQGLEDYTTDIVKVGEGLDNLFKSILASKANTDSLITLLNDPKVDPFDVLDSYIDNFIKELPDKLPPEAEAVLRAAGGNLGVQMQKSLFKEGGILPDAKKFQKAFSSVLSKQKPFFDATIDLYKTFFDSHLKQLNLAISSKELLTKTRVDTSETDKTVAENLHKTLGRVGINLDLPNLSSEVVDQYDRVNDFFVDLAKSANVAEKVISKYQGAFKKQAQLQRDLAIATQTGEGANIGLLNSFENNAIGVLDLQKAFVLLQEALGRAPQALVKQQEEQRKLPARFDEKAAARDTRLLEQRVENTKELLNQEKQFIEAWAAIDVSQAFEKPADIFADALRESASALKVFTAALTSQDMERGRLDTQIQRRLPTDSVTLLPRQPKEPDKIETKHLQSALFGGPIENVLEAMLQAASEMAASKAAAQFDRYEYSESEANRALAQHLNEFSGFIFDIPKFIRDSDLDLSEVAKAVASTVIEQAGEPGAKEVDFLGVDRTFSDLVNSIETLIKRPEVARRPQDLIEQLTPAMQENLRRLTPATERVPTPEAAPRVFEELRSSATDIQHGASEIRMAADATNRSTEEMGAASTDVRIGGTDILAASQSMAESAKQMQAVVDVQREAIVRQQEADATGGGTNGEGIREAMSATTTAINDLGKRVDAVAQAVDIQTQQESQLASVEQNKSLEVTGLEENTEAISTNNEVSSKTQEGISNLNDGMNKMSEAMEEGVGVNIETMSEIRIDIQGVADAAKEFTKEFEAVAHKVAKQEITILLQQLASAAGNAEESNTFESVI